MYRIRWKNPLKLSETKIGKPFWLVTVDDCRGVIAKIQEKGKQDLRQGPESQNPNSDPRSDRWFSLHGPETF